MNYHHHRIMLHTSMPPLSHARNSPKDDLENSSKQIFEAYILLAVFATLFFILLVFYYFKTRSSSSDPESGDMHGQAASRSLAVVTVVAETAGECSICLEEVEEGKPVKMIAYCKHIFHAECLDKWLETNVTCPLCRYSETSAEVELVGGGGEEDPG